MSFLLPQTKVRSRQTRPIFKASIRNEFLANKQDGISCQCVVNEKYSSDGATVTNQPETQLQRQLNSIRYSIGGTTQYGNFATNESLDIFLKERRNNPNFMNNGLISFNGKYEGQPGGISGPLRNKF